MFDIKDDGSLNIYLSIDDKIVSSLTINDGIKEGVENTLNELSKKVLKHICLQVIQKKMLFLYQKN